MAADFLTLQDLYNRVPANTVNGYFDDSNNGTISEESAIVQDVLSAAEGEFYSRIMRAYPGNPKDPGGAVQLLVANDSTLRMHIAWIAVEIACERRVEFTTSEGWGAYRAQYERAVKYIDNVSKGLQRSSGETQAGKGANTGGNLQPAPPAGTVGQFVFASSRDAPGGHGGF